MIALGEKLEKYPPFLATVIFEVRKKPNTDDFTVNAFYINQTVKEPYPIVKLNLDKCPEISPEAVCKLTSFDTYLKPYVQDIQWASECGLTNIDAFQLAEDNIGDS